MPNSKYVINAKIDVNARSPLRDYLTSVVSQYRMLRNIVTDLPSGEIKEESILALSDSMELAIKNIDEYCDKRKKY